MNTFRDPVANERIDIHTEQNQYMAFLGNTDMEKALAAPVFRPDNMQRSLAGFVNSAVE
jgi:hypothetical protein